MTLISNYKYSKKLPLLVLRSALVFILSSMLTVAPVFAAEANAEKKESQQDVELKAPKKKAASVGNFDNTQIQPANLTPRSSAEFYSTIPDARLLVPIHVWGEVKEPGLHFVPMGSSISEAISSSGGPLATASLPNVNLIHKNEKEKDVNLFKTGLNERVVANDTIVVDRSLKADLPIIFSGLSVLVAVGTMIALILRTR